MKYRVGLDVGTASFAVAAFSVDNNEHPVDLIWRRIHIFNEPVEKGGKGQLVSKKAARRQARMQRRQIDRKIGRSHHIAQLARLLGLSDKLYLSKTHNFPELRAAAARERVDLIVLFKILLRMAKKRGYAGVFKSKENSQLLNEVEGGSSDLKNEMQALADSRGLAFITLGEFLYQRWLDGKPTKLKVKDKAEGKKRELENRYALREQVKFEFEQIWDTQAKFHPVLNATHKDQLLKQIFSEAIFFQRPLKSVTSMVGLCALEPNLPRAPRAQPVFQKFRIEKTIADLRWGGGKRAEKLLNEQKYVIRSLLNEKATVSFSAIEKALEVAGCAKPIGKALNLEGAARDELIGNKTEQVFRKLDLSETWQVLDEATQIQVINFLADLGSPEQLQNPEWHIQSKQVKSHKIKLKNGNEQWVYKNEPRIFTQTFVDFINRMANHKDFERLGALGFDGGRASYSIKALKKLTDWFAEPWSNENTLALARADEDAAINVVYAHIKQQPKKSLSRLEPAKPTGNAVVDGSLRQIYFVINKMIDELGAPPDEIVVEMAREMGLGITRRNERERDNAKNRTARLNAEKEIRARNVTVTPSRVKRYLLWVEQGETYCPYCEKYIKFEAAMSGAETEYEHILPKSLTQVGSKRSEIVLAHSSCNQEKGNQTPYQAFGRDEYRWTIIQARAKYFADKKQYRKAKLLLLEDFENEVLNDESIVGFAERQFHQASWIAKAAATWLQAICTKPVSVSRGQLVAMLRKQWRLETVIPEVRIEEGLPIFDEEGQVIDVEDFNRYKPVWEGHRAPSRDLHTDRKLNKRIDHRHHLIDAITIALTSRSLFMEMAKQYKAAAEKMQPRDGETVEAREKRLKYETHARLRAPEPPIKNIRQIALKAIRECPLFIKPDRKPDGAMFKDTPYGRAFSDKEGRFMLTRRYKLIDLVADLKEKKAKDGSPKQTIEEQAKENILSIVSSTTRRIVLTEFEKRLKEGRTVIEAMLEPIYQEAYLSEKTKPLPIKRVVCFSAFSAEDAAPIEHLNRKNPKKPFFKYLRDGGYAYMEISKNDYGAVEAKLVDVQEGMQEKGKKEPQNTTRYYKGDVVEDLSSGLKYRIKKFAAGDGKNPRPTMITLAWTESAEDVGKVKQSHGRMDFFKDRLLQIKPAKQNV